VYTLVFLALFLWKVICIIKYERLYFYYP
jgi:hypothetical protein